MEEIYTEKARGFQTPFLLVQRIMPRYIAFGAHFGSSCNTHTALIVHSNLIRRYAIFLLNLTLHCNFKDYVCNYQYKLPFSLLLFFLSLPIFSWYKQLGTSDCISVCPSIRKFYRKLDFGPKSIRTSKLPISKFSLKLRKKAILCEEKIMVLNLPFKEPLFDKIHKSKSTFDVYFK